MKIKIQLLFPVLFIGCYMHHANVKDDYYGAKSIVPDLSNKTNSSLPIRLELIKIDKYQARSYLLQKGVNVEVKDELFDSYHSEEIISKIKSSKYFISNINANMKLKISSTVEEVKEPVISILPAIFTFGIIPAIFRSNGLIEFEFYDLNKNDLVKVYKYPVEHRYFCGLSSVILAPIFNIFSERFDHSQNEKTFAIMRVAYQQFEEDLVKDLVQDKEFVSRFKVDKSKTTAFLINDNDKKKEENQIVSGILSSLESKYIERGVSVIERKKLNLIYNELKLSQLGITDSNGISVGKVLNADKIVFVADFNNMIINDKFEMTIKCIEVKSGSILWTKKSSVS